jgi:hypothetical protein
MYKSVSRLVAAAAVLLCTLGSAAAPARSVHAASRALSAGTFTSASASTKLAASSWCYDPYWGWYICNYNS